MGCLYWRQEKSRQKNPASQFNMMKLLRSLPNNSSGSFSDYQSSSRIADRASASSTQDAPHAEQIYSSALNRWVFCVQLAFFICSLHSRSYSASEIINHNIFLLLLIRILTETGPYIQANSRESHPSGSLLYTPGTLQESGLNTSGKTHQARYAPYNRRI